MAELETFYLLKNFLIFDEQNIVKLKDFSYFTIRMGEKVKGLLKEFIEKQENIEISLQDIHILDFSSELFLSKLIVTKLSCINYKGVINIKDCNILVRQSLLEVLSSQLGYCCLENDRIFLRCKLNGQN